MRTYSIEETAKEITKRLEGVNGSSYFTFEQDSEDSEQDITIRVSEHSARHRNNDGLTFSFCTNFVSHSDSNPMLNEWIVDEDGYCEDYGKSIIKLLEWELS
jgi:hypothetical protein